MSPQVFDPMTFSYDTRTFILYGTQQIILKDIGILQLMYIITFICYESMYQ